LFQICRGVFDQHAATRCNTQPYPTADEPCILSKETIILSKEPYILSKKPCILSKEPYILSIYDKYVYQGDFFQIYQRIFVSKIEVFGFKYFEGFLFQICRGVVHQHSPIPQKKTPIFSQKRSNTLERALYSLERSLLSVCCIVCVAVDVLQCVAVCCSGCVAMYCSRKIPTQPYPSGNKYTVLQKTPASS